MDQRATDPGGSGLPALIEEEVRDRLARSLRLTAWIVDRMRTRLGTDANTQVVAQVLDAGNGFQNRRLRPLGHPPRWSVYLGDDSGE